MELNIQTVSTHPEMSRSGPKGLTSSDAKNITVSSETKAEEKNLRKLLFLDWRNKMLQVSTANGMQFKGRFICSETLHFTCSKTVRSICTKTKHKIETLVLAQLEDSKNKSPFKVKIPISKITYVKILPQ